MRDHFCSLLSFLNSERQGTSFLGKRNQIPLLGIWDQLSVSSPIADFGPDYSLGDAQLLSALLCPHRDLSEGAQSCLTLCDPMDCSLLDCSIHGIFQARTLAWLPFPSPGDLPNSGIEPGSPTLHANTFLSEPDTHQNSLSWHLVKFENNI